MITNFGIWEIDKEFGIIGRVSQTFKYRIAKETLWNTSEYKGHIVWEWLIHLSEKTWVNKEIFNDLVIAYIFSQDYLSKHKPQNSKQGSIAQSIYIGKQLVELTMESDNSDETELDLSSEKALEELDDIFKKYSEIKPLD